MRRRDVAAGFLFWVMIALGGGSLSACLVLPAWLEYRTARQRLTASQREVWALEREARARRLQLLHHQQDLEYNQRVLSRELRAAPRGQTFLVDLHEGGAEPLDAQSEASSMAGASGQLAALVETAARDHPLVSVFVLRDTRPFVMALSGLVIVIAMVTLNPRER